MSVFGDLVMDDNVEIDQSIIECTAHVIQQYALEDGLIDSGNSDIKLEILMRTAERYLKRYMDVVNANQRDPKWIFDWQHKQIKAFNDHAREYELLYRSIAHMQEAPYFMSQWSICFLVDAALTEHGIHSSDAFHKLTKVELENLQYTIRFCENLLQALHQEFMLKR